MKRIVTLLALVFTFTAAAQNAAPAKPLLWRIAGTKPSYVFGTIHLGGPRETALAPAVSKAIEECDALFCEIPMDAGSQLKAAASMMSGGSSLKQTLPKDLYERADAELKRINPSLSLAPFDRMPVWGLGVMLPLIEEQMKNPMGKPLDVQLYARAEAAGKTVGGIETVDEQMGVLSGFTSDEQLALLRSTLDELEKARRENRSVIGDMRESYLAGDPAALDSKMKETMKSLNPAIASRVISALITSRNHRMAERIAAKLKDGGGKSFFFAIGAGHLHGEEGVVRLLQKAGVRIDRVE
jgi:uncharacterized protein YbaP (TraB family)